MIDIVKFTETKQKLIGFYESKLNQFEFPKETQEEFFSIVEDRYKVVLEGSGEDPSNLYENVIRYTFQEMIKVRNKALRKLEKKSLRNKYRGTVIWDTKKQGQYRRTK